MLLTKLDPTALSDSDLDQLHAVALAGYDDAKALCAWLTSALCDEMVRRLTDEPVSPPLELPSQWAKWDYIAALKAVSRLGNAAETPAAQLFVGQLASALAMPAARAFVS